MSRNNFVLRAADECTRTSAVLIDDQERRKVCLYVQDIQSS